MYDWLDNLPFAYFHVFSYSKRDHTRAARMTDQVPAPVARERSALLRSLSDRKSAAYNSRFRGKVLPVLVEEESDGPPGPDSPRGSGIHGRNGQDGRTMTGRTDHGLRMRFESAAAQAVRMNAFVEVEVVSTDAEGAAGRLSEPAARP